MPDRPSLSIIVPAYNEESRLAPTIRAMVAHVRATGRRSEVVVVDDGSRDGTSDVAHRLADELAEVRLVRLAANHGKGYAVRTGVMNSRGERILFADADGATPIEELARLDAAVDAGADVAIGSRSHHAAGVVVRKRWYRHVMGRAFHAMVSLLTVRGIADTQCGFKLFRGPVAHDLFSRMRMSGFSFDVEVLLMAQRQRLRVDEVAVNWAHQEGSRVNLVLDSFRMAADLVRIHTNAIQGRYVAPHIRPWHDALAAAELPPVAGAPRDPVAV